MAAPTVQTLAVPDVGVGPGPFPSPAWVLSTIENLLNLGLDLNATKADSIALLGAAVNTDPITAANPNVVGYFTSGGLKQADVLHATACVFFAILRFVPQNGGTPTAGLTFEMQGT